MTRTIIFGLLFALVFGAGGFYIAYPPVVDPPVLPIYPDGTVVWTQVTCYFTPAGTRSVYWAPPGNIPMYRFFPDNISCNVYASEQAWNFGWGARLAAPEWESEEDLEKDGYNTWKDDLNSNGVGRDMKFRVTPVQQTRRYKNPFAKEKPHIWGPNT